MPFDENMKLSDPNPYAANIAEGLRQQNELKDFKELLTDIHNSGLDIYYKRQYLAVGRKEKERRGNILFTILYQNNIFVARSL